VVYLLKKKGKREEKRREEKREKVFLEEYMGVWGLSGL